MLLHRFFLLSPDLQPGPERKPVGSYKEQPPEEQTLIYAQHLIYSGWALLTLQISFIFTAPVLSEITSYKILKVLCHRIYPYQT